MHSASGAVTSGAHPPSAQVLVIIQHDLYDADEINDAAYDDNEITALVSGIRQMEQLGIAQYPVSLE